VNFHIVDRSRVLLVRPSLCTTDYIYL